MHLFGNKSQKKYILVLVLFLLFVVTFGLHYFVKYKKYNEVKEVNPLKTPTLLETDSFKEITHGNRNNKNIIFTFDGGSTTDSVDEILRVLEKHHVRGTFFMTGKMIEKNPELIKKIASGNNEIFNHTYDHRYLTRLKDKDIVNELQKMNSALETATGTSSKPFFRAPYGDRDARVLKVAESAGYRSVYWSIDALDWRELLGETSSSVEKIILSNLKPGNIFLMHVGDKITGEILDQVFTKIEKQGFKIVSLTEGIK